VIHVMMCMIHMICMAEYCIENIFKKFKYVKFGNWIENINWNYILRVTRFKVDNQKRRTFSNVGWRLKEMNTFTSRTFLHSTSLMPRHLLPASVPTLDFLTELFNAHCTCINNCFTSLTCLLEFVGRELVATTTP